MQDDTPPIRPHRTFALHWYHVPSRPSDRRVRPPARVAAGRVSAWLARGDRRARLLKLATLVIGIPSAIGLVIATGLWISYGRMIDRRLGGEQRPAPRIFGRPF